VNTSPVSPDDIRAAAAAHHELGPEYSDAVVAAFLERVDRAVAARAEARLASMRRASQRRANLGTLLTGLAVGACTGALAAGLVVASLNSDGGPASQGQVPPNVHVQLMPVYRQGHPLPPHRVPRPGGG